MNAIAFTWFLANLLLALALLRVIQLKWPNSAIGRGLGVITGGTD